MGDAILMVDDEPALLDGIRRQLRGRFAIETAIGPEAALASHPWAVVVSDLRMPGMDGIHFLAEVRERVPDSTRIMLTGQADVTAAIQAVNRGNLFRFLTKPRPRNSPPPSTPDSPSTAGSLLNASCWRRPCPAASRC